MCMNAAECIPFHLYHPLGRKPQSKKSKARVVGHIIWRGRGKCESKEEKEMELKNLKLYWKNQSIIEENEKLRKMANLLHQEKLTLMSQFQKQFPQLSDTFSTT